jgi:hypothetical protein
LAFGNKISSLFPQENSVKRTIRVKYFIFIN